MAKVLPLRYWDDPVLSTVCGKIEDGEFGSQLEEFGAELLATMDASNGIGLAAPQVGVLKQMFVMRFPDREEMPPRVICNPTLELSGATLLGREGCLSLPGIFEQVARAEQAVLTARTPSGEHFGLVLNGMDARVAQHEFDHLHGIMFFDSKDKRPIWGARMSRQVSRSVLREWEKEKKKRGI
jgi:peptide deformylase